MFKRAKQKLKYKLVEAICATYRKSNKSTTLKVVH